LSFSEAVLSDVAAGGAAKIMLIEQSGNSFQSSKSTSTAITIMILTGNTILITGGGTGIGRGLAELDIANPESIRKVSAKLIADYPSLNTLINNAGIMLLDDVSTTVDEGVLEGQVATNPAGTIRLTSSPVEHLKKQKRATIVYNSSTLAFTPLARLRSSPLPSLLSTPTRCRSDSSFAIRRSRSRKSPHRGSAPVWSGKVFA
jgi:hypothetical protein